MAMVVALVVMIVAFVVVIVVMLVALDVRRCRFNRGFALDFIRRTQRFAFHALCAPNQLPEWGSTACIRAANNPVFS
jgi:hypothetical protein